MSDLVYQNYNNRCQGWTNPTSNVFGPQINGLSGYYSPAGSTTLVSISGSGFYSYSTLAFGTYNPTSYFINSNNIQFYVPLSLNSGTYTVQIFNGSIGSNIVNYTIDNASGFWLLNSNGTISNTNSGLVPFLLFQEVHLLLLLVLHIQFLKILIGLFAIHQV